MLLFIVALLVIFWSARPRELNSWRDIRKVSQKKRCYCFRSVSWNYVWKIKSISLDSRCKLTVHKTFLLDVLFTFNLGPCLGVCSWEFLENYFIEWVALEFIPVIQFLASITILYTQNLSMLCFNMNPGLLHAFSFFDNKYRHIKIKKP